VSTTDPAFDALVRVWSDENGDLRHPFDVLKALRASGWNVVAATPAPLDVERVLRALRAVLAYPAVVDENSEDRIAAAIAAAYVEEADRE